MIWIKPKSEKNSCHFG